MTLRANHLVLPVAFLFLSVGCESRYELAPVSGTVTLDGRPVAGAQVSFEPQASGENAFAGPGSYGTTDKEGRYRLETIDGREGAVVGKHYVFISTLRLEEDEEDNPVEAAPESIPDHYNVESELTFSVPPAGTNQADFRLESD